MEKRINGLHHITAIAGDPQQNYDFYTQVLGMRFVKKTVNFDAPDVYHFYFADELGTPGTVLTFFPFPNARRGKHGAGEANIISFAVPKGSLDFWIERLSFHGISFDGPYQKFGYNYLSFLDSDGMKLELVEDNVAHLTGWETNEVPRKHSIRKFFGVTMYLNDSEKTEVLLKDVMGFRLHQQEGNIKRYISGTEDFEAKVDIIVNPNAERGTQSAGSVHHISWRTESDTSQVGWMHKLKAAGYHTTDVIDRNYFHSIYFREPGGVLFEIATDEPGFMIDEDRENLGQSLKLPKQYESRRTEIEKILIPINQNSLKIS
ncbi:MAG: ring-cleaving dioxygenase [Melioribacteraceae bacterium]|nr:ring-cleaving dioxygenase [Melioribacteraceae bacterium]MCF8356357.1 ring-cleaving dioxygenase [Melioribacteraceae bacterium]MCF8395796.1 ring-cleaving dioxygenase [Melioribacteraceae bacterium]MCF8420661.1 ring-cleaving dioxygenase [Melioribacteraceae bacterium]